MTLPNVPQDPNMTEPVRAWLERAKREIETALATAGAITVPTKATEAEAATGTNDEKFLTPLSGVEAVKTHSPFVKFAYYEDQKAVNTEGGNGNTSYTKRDLNTEVYNNIGASLSSSEVTLPAGEYLAEGSCPAFRVNVHKCRLYNVTGAAVLAYGTSEFNAVGSGDLVTTRSTVVARFTLASSAAIRLEHVTGNTTSAADYGKRSNQTGVEIYSTLKIWKLD